MSDCTVTEVKSGEKKPCQFPFTTKGETFFQCTDKVGNLTFDKPWCSTKTERKNGQNVHIPNQGYYGEDCNCFWHGMYKVGLGEQGGWGGVSYYPHHISRVHSLSMFR